MVGSLTSKFLDQYNNKMKKLCFVLLVFSLLIDASFAAEVSITMADFDTQESTLLSPTERNDKIFSTLDDQK